MNILKQPELFPQSEDEQKEPNFDEALKIFSNQCEIRAGELSRREGVNVESYVFVERKDGKPTGNVFVAYVKDVNAFALAKAMDYYIDKRVFEAGSLLYASCVLPETDKEIEQNPRMQTGLMGTIGASLDVIAPEIKKK